MANLVGQYDARITQVKGKTVTTNSKLQYDYAVNNFRRFAAAYHIPRDIFVRPAADIRYTVVCWTLHGRHHDTGRTRDTSEPDALGDHLLLPITGKTLDVRVSALKDFVQKYGGNADALRGPDLAQVLKALQREDDIVRGPSDFYVRYPLGAEFTWRVIQRIRASADTRRVQLLYEAASAIEYLFGLRVMEALEKSHAAHDPYVLPNYYLPNEDPRIVAKERAAAIHTVRNRDLLLFWRDENIVCAAHEGARFLNRPPDFVTMFQDHTKNWRAGPPPSSIHANPHGDHAAPFCLCAIVFELLKPDRARAAADFLLLGAHHTKLRQLVKATATDVGFDPTRTVLAGWRRGCASATIVGNAARDAADALRQQHQHWHSAAAAQVYVEGQLDDGLEKTIQLYDLRSTSIVATRTRFNRAR